MRNPYQNPRASKALSYPRFFVQSLAMPRTVWIFLLLSVGSQAFLNAKISPWQKVNRATAGKVVTSKAASKWACNGKASDGYLACTEDWIVQKIDNFNSNDTRTWKMRYQIMDKYFKNQSSPVIFLMIGGEDKISPYWVQDPQIQYLQWAKNFSAMVYQTEHRFFGESHPLPDMTTANLKYLNTTQALEDLAFFIKSMNAKNKWVNPRWVTFGGSYPGSMAAWFRSKYSNLTVGSVASSAPLNLKLDFNEYTLVMQNTIRNVSQPCYDAVDRGFDLMSKMILTTNGRASINKIFDNKPAFADSSVTKLQIYNFFANVFAPFQDIIQYTYDGLGALRENDLTVFNMCKTVEQPSKTYQKGTPEDYADRIAQVVEMYNQGQYKKHVQMDNDYAHTISSYQNVSFDGSNAAGRGWMWLCCNEIGFLQTTELGKNIFHDLVPMNYYMQQCTDMFGPTVGPTFVRDHNYETQKYYGGVDYFDATNLFLPTVAWIRGTLWDITRAMLRST
ncbi:hypothetical protein L596_030258 [Steinernema carpocapsae]|uniref:Serine carboxypeptidase S28 n=1 Tax=Steinernema carpocapsae TaxID=34508 RepID=A0A4U5LS76_STECR|nr:hypothetical protein L596_030258 [Steinernema carpocapsae]